MNAKTQSIRRDVAFAEFDYAFLKTHLADYANPRDKISRLIRNHDIIRVKKGLYVLGQSWCKVEYSRQVLANLIYGPSYISLESALSHYGLIPERVEAVTSVTVTRRKQFHTPLGDFIYSPVGRAGYDIGVGLKTDSQGRNYLMASLEKAIADYLLLNVKNTVRNKIQLTEFLFDDMRFDRMILKTLRLSLLKQIAHVRPCQPLELLTTYLKA